MRRQSCRTLYQIQHRILHHRTTYKYLHGAKSKTAATVCLQVFSCLIYRLHAPSRSMSVLPFSMSILFCLGQFLFSFCKLFFFLIYQCLVSFLCRPLFSPPSFLSFSLSKVITFFLNYYVLCRPVNTTYTYTNYHSKHLLLIYMYKYL